MAREVFRTGYRVEDLIAQRRERVRERLQALSADDLRSTDVDDIVSGILSIGTIRVPVLRRHLKHLRPTITFQAPQPRPNSWDSRDGTGPPPITAYRFVLEVPFEGDGEVFDYPHTPAVRSIPASVELNSLYVKHETTHINQTEITAQLEAHCDTVERVLAAIRELAEPWNLECERWVREEVDRKVEGVRTADAVVAAMSSRGTPAVEAEECGDVGAMATPLLPGITEEVRRQLISGLERGAMKVRDDAESALEELRMDIAKKGQARGGVADGRLSRFHLRVMEQCLQHLWSGLLRLREQCNAPPVESEEILARIMACYVDHVLSPVLQLVRGDRVASGSWDGGRNVKDTAQRWKAKYAADARDAMAEVVAEQQIEALPTRKPDTSPVSRPQVFDFGVVTALPLEFAAMKRMLDGVYPVVGPPDDANHYEAGFIEGTHGKQHVIMTMTPKMGTNTAATTVSALMTSFKPKYLLMVGIAGGMPAPNRPVEHVRLGDVVISSEGGLFQHDHVKLEDGELIERDNSARPSAALVQNARVLVANAYAGVRPWDTHVERAAQAIEKCARPSADTDILYGPDGAPIPHPADAERLPDRSKIYVGRIGSGNMLLRDASRREELRARHGLVAIEMEGAGIGDASWQWNGRFLIIRGISDYCDRHKSDLWQGYAAAAAAAVARALIELF